MNNQQPATKDLQSETSKRPLTRNPWAWVPSLYFAEGLPYIIVMTLSVIMYKRLGISNSDIALYTSWLYLPWVIKPLWSPLVDMLKTKRWWIVVMQLIIGVGLAGIAFTIPVHSFFQYTLAFFWLLAFSSATHDIAADGFYLLALDEGDQSYFVGIRSTFYRLAMLTGQGLLVILAGSIESNTGEEPFYINVKTIESKEITLPQISELARSDKDGFWATNTIEIAAVPVESKVVDSIVSQAKQHNIANQFYETESKKLAEDESEGFWTKYISKPLRGFLSKHFTTTKSKSQETGNIGIAQIKLNKKPEVDEEIVLNLSRQAGDKGVEIVEGTRFVFDANNWDKQALVAIKIDKNLKSKVFATFIGRSGNIKLAWSISFGVIALFFVLFFIYHRFIFPYPVSDKAVRPDKEKSFIAVFLQTIVSFFKKKKIGVALAFLLLYRLGESQLVKLASPFLLDSTESGGLGLSTGQVGVYYGTFGIIALSLGGILGGIAVSRKGLKYWLWWMVLAINLPNLVYVYLSNTMPGSGVIVAISIAVEQFGYGFGFTAYMMYSIYIAQGENKTAHFAIATGLMALGMMIPGMISGWLQDIIGYQNFFVWVMLCTIPGFIVVALLKIEPEFGKKKDRK